MQGLGRMVGREAGRQVNLKMVDQFVHIITVIVLFL